MFPFTCFLTDFSIPLYYNYVIFFVKEVIHLNKKETQETRWLKKYLKVLHIIFITFRGTLLAFKELKGYY